MFIHFSLARKCKILLAVRDKYGAIHDQEERQPSVFYKDWYCFTYIYIQFSFSKYRVCPREIETYEILGEGSPPSLLLFTQKQSAKIHHVRRMKIVLCDKVIDSRYRDEINWFCIDRGQGAKDLLKFVKFSVHFSFLVYPFRCNTWVISATYIVLNVLTLVFLNVFSSSQSKICKIYFNKLSYLNCLTFVGFR
jgi:hypothetical protein